MKFRQVIDMPGSTDVLGIDDEGHLVRISFKPARSRIKGGPDVPCAQVTYVALDVLNAPGDYQSPPTVSPEPPFDVALSQAQEALKVIGTGKFKKEQS